MAHRVLLVLKQRLPARLTPLARRLGLRPFYGDIHNHCGLSYGHGRLEDALLRAKRQLDFVSITVTPTGLICRSDDPPSCTHRGIPRHRVAKLAKAWPGHSGSTMVSNEPGSFTVFPGYEIHSLEHGDYTIIYKDLQQRELGGLDSPSQLLTKLDQRYGEAAIAFPTPYWLSTGGARD